MTLLAITSFTGEMPRIGVDKLPQNAAQATLDCLFTSGDLESAKGLGDLIKLAGGLSNPTGAFFTDDGNFFTWTGDYTVAKGTVIDDFYKRVYLTNGGLYLLVCQQQDANRGVAGWDPGVTYALNAEALYPMVLPFNYSGVVTYAQGDIRQYPTNSRILYRALRSNNLNNEPDINPAWWELWGEGKRYKSLQNGNTAKTPTEEPTWWVQNGASLPAITPPRAGVPAPNPWTAKLYGVGTYNVNVVAADPTGALDVYHVPQAAADARAATDGSLTGIANTNALIAVSRNLLQANLVIKARDDATPNTGMAYYTSSSVKQAESEVTLYPVTPGRLYTFDAPQKTNEIAEYTVTQLWSDPGNAALAGTSAYFDGTRTATIQITAESTILVVDTSSLSDWTSLTGLSIPPTTIDGVLGITLINGAIVSVPELNRVATDVQTVTVGLRIRGYDGTTNAIQFEVDSENSDFSATNTNLAYVGLRLVLTDLRGGPWLGAWSAGTYAAGSRVSYTRSATTYGFVSLRDGNVDEPLPPDYAGGTTYALGDKVFESGSTWISLQAANTGNTPHSNADWWMVYFSEWWTLRQFSAELTYGTTRLSYVFVYTLVNDWNEEGPPSDPVSIDADYGDVISLHGYISLSGYAGYRLGAAGYRLRYYGFVADSQGSGEYRLIRETEEFGSSSFAGPFGLQITTKPADWEDPLATTLFELPPASPIAIAGGENGMLGVITQGYFAPCEPFKGWAWPTDYRKALSTRAVGLLSTPGGWLITTQKKPRFAAGPIPEQISLQEILIEQAGISQKAMCSMGERGTAYASNDGIVIVQGLGATLASGVLFTRKEWRARYSALLSKMRLAYHDGRLVALFPGTAQSEASNYQGFTIRLDDGGAPMYARMSVTGSGVTVDTLDDQLLVANLTGFKAFEEGVALPLTWQSKEFITAKPENMGAVMIEYSGGPLSIDTHADGVNVLTKTLPYAATRVEARWRLPAGFKSQRWSVYVTEGVPLNWSSLTTYAAGDTVTSGGVPWLSLQAANLNHAPVTGSMYWSQIGGEIVHRILLATTMSELTKA